MSKKRPTEVIRADGPIRHNRTTGELMIMTDELPSSSRSYVAQVVRVSTMGDSVQFSFGQVVQPPRRLLSVAVVETTVASLRKLHETLTSEFRDSARRLGKSSESLVLTDGEVGSLAADRFFVAYANISRMTITDMGSQVDWFQLEPAEVRRIAGGGAHRDSIMAPLTVMMSSDLLITLIEQIDLAFAAASGSSR